MPLTSTGQISVFDSRVRPSADGSSGLWWRESHVPTHVLAGHLDFIYGPNPAATSYPDERLPGAMFASGDAAWIGLLRLGRYTGGVNFRLATGLPNDITEIAPFTTPGPNLTAAVEDSLRIVLRYRDRVLTLALPVSQQDPYSFRPEGQAAEIAAICRAVEDDLGDPRRPQAEIALVNAEVADVSDPANPLVPIFAPYAVNERALNPADVALYALEIDHPAAGTVRVVNDVTDHTIDDEIYVALRFDVAEASDADGEVTHAEVQVDNVGQELNAWVERSRGGIGATVRVLRITARTSEVEWDLTLDVVSVRVDAAKVYASLGFDPLLGRPACSVRYDPDTTPGIF